MVGGQVTAAVGYVTKSPGKNIIRLEKTCKGPGGALQSHKYNIAKGDWAGIKRAIEALLPEIGDTPTEQDIDNAIHRVSRETQLLELIARYPELLSQIPKDVDILSLPHSQKDGLRQLLLAGGEIANSIITKLARQPVGDIEQFSQLLDDFKLSTINSSLHTSPVVSSSLSCSRRLSTMTVLTSGEVQNRCTTCSGRISG